MAEDDEESKKQPLLQYTIWQQTK